MASSGSVFSETLQSITNTKLEELSKKRQAFETQKATALKDMQQKKDPLEKLITLANGVKLCFGVKVYGPSANTSSGSSGASDGMRAGRVINGSSNNPRLELQLRNLDRFLEQVRYDPSISPAILLEWQNGLMQHLDVQSSKYQYASLYGQLVTEWLSAEKKTAAPATDEDMEMSEGYEEIPTSGKKMDSRAKWEQAVFEPFEVDEDAIKNYLKSLFGKNGKDKVTTKALTALRETVQQFEVELTRPGQFNTGSLYWAIDGLLQSDLLTDEKRAVLKDFRANPLILTELADVLNMRLSALSSWSWGEHVPVEQRRMVSGTYHIYMHEDLLQAIFLQFLGVKWSVFFRQAFKTFAKTEGAWKSFQQDIPKDEMARLRYFLESAKPNNSLQHKRQMVHRKHFHLSQLLDHETQQIIGDEGAEEAEYSTMAPQAMQAPSGRTKQTARVSTGGAAPRKQLASMSARHAVGQSSGQTVSAEIDYSDEAEGEGDSSEDDGDESLDTKDPMAAKQTLLHLLASEIIINRHVHGGLTCFHSMFDSWMSSLPHSTIKLVLHFFGVSEKFIDFFRTFLQAPLRFIDEPNSEPRLRQRGTPGAHVLSEVFGEAILFCLDYSVNQATEGKALHRMHDDIWFWSPSHSTVVKAWDAVTTFAEVMGVSLNENKSGCARITSDSKSKQSDAKIDGSLPKGDIRWGFLRLDPASGRFEIDMAMVDSHIDDLKRQLADRKSIFSWIQAWNTFATTFFTTNFGKPANCYGRAHADMMLSSLKRVQERVFADGEGSVVGHLKQELKRRFGPDDVPDGFLFFPSELGGLDLTNPFVGALQIRDALLEEPAQLTAEFDEAEAESYAKLRAAFDKGDAKMASRQHQFQRKRLAGPFNGQDLDLDRFLTFDEYTKHREDLSFRYSPDLGHVFDKLMERPDEASIEPSEQVNAAITALGRSGMGNLRGITTYWYGMDAYWKWITAMYGPDMIERFGGLNIVDPGLLPIGMVSLFRSGRVSWQG